MFLARLFATTGWINLLPMVAVNPSTASIVEEKIKRKDRVTDFNEVIVQNALLFARFTVAVYEIGRAHV